ncbi:hypothetical protein [Candidatus Ruthia endofausta]|uniref:hypothetical protein n=1 Tax=Candidatus Ruthia endofausta TaxID=2738852 RepID=UPI003BF49568
MVYEVDNVDSDTSSLEMLDQLNERLITQGGDCILFDYDYREGICGACVAVCPNENATLFVAAKITHLALLPQGKIESKNRAKDSF